MRNKETAIPLLTQEIRDFLSPKEWDPLQDFCLGADEIQSLLATGKYKLTVKRFNDGRIKEVGVTETSAARKIREREGKDAVKK